MKVAVLDGWPDDNRTAQKGPGQHSEPIPLMTRHATGGMVLSIDHLASEAGVACLRSGGSAADAAVAASAVLAVTSPHMCGMGGDLFALVSVPGDSRPQALNASGRAGSGADPGRLRSEGNAMMPFSGDLRSAPVPGCVDGWVALHERHGRLPLPEIMKSAIAYADEGFPASPLLAGTARVLDGVAGCEELNGTSDASWSDRASTRCRICVAGDPRSRSRRSLPRCLRQRPARDGRRRVRAVRFRAPSRRLGGAPVD